VSSWRWLSSLPGLRRGAVSVRVPGVVPDHPLGGQVHHQVAKPDLRLAGVRAGPADRGPHPGQQLFHAERLGHVVIGTRVQGHDLVGAVGPPGQHDDRRLGPAAQPLDDLHAIQVRQAKVEDHQVGRVLGGGLQRL
jgi:hypothetical protein